MTKRKPPRILSKRELDARLRGRLRDVLWSLRQRYVGTPVVPCVDRIMPYLVFNQTLTQDMLNELFIPYPKRTPKDYYAALCVRVCNTVQIYWEFLQVDTAHTIVQTVIPATHKAVLSAILDLEHILRDGDYSLVEDPIVGYVLASRG